jgi:hypothetical protein
MAFSILLITAISFADGGSSTRGSTDATSLVARLDTLVAGHWQSAGTIPAELADDCTFLRRLMLDLVGRIPTQREAIAFTEDRSPDKRQQMIRQPDRSCDLDHS